MLHIKMPHGYNTTCFDRTFVIHTGKIRIKADYASITNQLNHCTQLQFKVSGNNSQYTTISFATTCSQTNDHLIAEINAVLCKIMHQRIDDKYAPKVWEPELCVVPFNCPEYIAL
jgi:hypothetical protein